MPQSTMVIHLNKTLSLLSAVPWPGLWTAAPARGPPCQAWPSLLSCGELAVSLTGRMGFHCCGGDSRAVVRMRKSHLFSKEEQAGR